MPLTSRILLLPELTSTHLWDMSNGPVKREVSAIELGLPDLLAVRIESWATLSTVEHPANNSELRAEGFAIAAELQRALGESVEVFYLSGYVRLPWPNRVSAVAHADGEAEREWRA
jgi:hypothetical protein